MLSLSIPRAAGAAMAFAFSCLLQAQPAVEPRAPNWLPADLLSWSPATDPDSPYNRSLVPLADRFSPPAAAENPALNAALNLNPHARPKEGRVMPLVAFDGSPAQGTRSSRFYAPTAWQYIDNLTYWGASRPVHRYISAPPAHVVDAAHRNGVPVMGNVFFVWNSSPDHAALQGVRDLLQFTGTGSNKVFPVADKLIEAATYFGFDGWFINQENYQTNTTDAQNMRDFIVYHRKHAPPNQRIIWYDAMAENGSRSFQNALTTANDGYMKTGTNPAVSTDHVAHSMFLNFWWYNTSNLVNSRSLAISRGLDPYELYAGIDTEGSGYSTAGLDWDELFPEGQPHNVSLGIYRPEWTFNSSSSSDPADAIKREITYWCGQNGDPANTSIPSGSSIPNWRGIAHYIPANSAVTAKPFFTHFNVGQGNQAAVNGVKSSSGPWTNLSTQDLLPTWKWNVMSTGTKLIPAFDFTDPYYGGTSLKITGNLAAANDIKLYQTKLPVAANTNLQLIHKRGVTGATAMQVGLAFEHDPGTFIYLDVGTSASTDWNTTNIPLSAHAGKTISLLSLRFASASAISGYSMKIGRLAIYDGAMAAPAPPSNLLVEAQNNVDVDTLSLRLKWTPSPDPVRQYNVYVRHADNSLTWAGASLNHVYFLPAARRINSESTIRIEVEAVSPTFGTSARTVSGEIAVPPMPDLSAPFITGYNPVTGAAIIGTSGTFTGTRTKDKVYDNDLTTFYDAANASGDWAGLDLGAGNAREVRAIAFCPRNGWAGRMTGGRFEGSTTADFSSGATLLHQVDVPPPGGVFTTVAIHHPAAFRYVRYLSADGGSCNVAEVKFYGPPPEPARSLEWDAGNPSNGSVIDPASGAWNTVAGNNVWNDGTSNFPWTNGSSARFGGGDGSCVINLAGDLNASSLAFAASGYTLTSAAPAAITLTGGLEVASGKSATISRNVSVLYNSNSPFTISSSGTLDIAAGATVAKTGTNNLLVSGTGTLNVAGHLSRTGNGTGSNSLRIGAASGDDITLNILPGGTVSHFSSNNRIEIGQGGQGTVNVNGGTLQAAGGGAILVGASGTKGTLDVTGGTVTSVNDIVIGNVAEGVLSVRGGTTSVTGTTGQRLVVAVNGPATVELSGDGVIDVAGTAGVHLGSTDASTGSGVIHLNGGMLKVPKISKIASQPGASAVIRFNGGTLMATASGSNFMEGLDAAKVGNGGAFIDTAGFDITIGQVLAHDDLANEKDGGLLKSGTGNLLLSGPNNYTGDTRVLAGELALGSASLGDDADLHISGGASLRLAHGISDTIRSLFLNGIRMKRGKYVPEGSTEAGIPTMFLTGSAGGLMVEADNFDDWAAGLPAGSRGREDDADKDGFNNLAEFLFGTPANSPDGALATISANSTGFTVRWLERDGGTYLVQEITDVSHWSPAPFTPVPSEQTGVPAGYNAMQVTVPLGTPTRMVRVRAEW